MTRHLRALAAFAPIAALGCAGVFGEGTCRERELAAASASMAARSVESSCKVLRSPGLLIEQSDAALGQRDFETAFAWLALARTLHPDHPETREVFPTASRVFRKAYMRHRTEAGSIWITSEPRFMFDWLASFFDGASEFPQPQANAFFLGMSYQMFRDYLAWAQERPELARWRLVAHDDNGWILEVTGGPAEAPAS